jgi:hypothetical protein
MQGSITYSKLKSINFYYILDESKNQEGRKRKEVQVNKQLGRCDVGEVA